jgi:hypothetical protein
MVISLHNYSLPKALIAAFPNIGLEPTKLYFGSKLLPFFYLYFSYSFSFLRVLIMLGIWRDNEASRKTHERDILQNGGSVANPMPGKVNKYLFFFSLQIMENQNYGCI